MSNQAPGTEQKPKTPDQKGTQTPGATDRTREDQMQQKGRQDQPGGSPQRDQPHDSQPGVNKDRNKG